MESTTVSRMAPVLVRRWEPLMANTSASRKELRSEQTSEHQRECKSVKTTARMSAKTMGLPLGCMLEQDWELQSDLAREHQREHRLVRMKA